MPHFILPKDLRPGDVLAYFNDYARQEFIEDGHSDRYYCHSGICVETGKIAHMGVKGLATETPEHILSTYDYAIVLRQQFVWKPYNIGLLQSFVEEMLCKDVTFDSKGVEEVNDQNRRINAKLTSILEKYFKNKEEKVIQTPSHKSESSFFCSDFVVCAFFEAEIFDESALQTVYQPKAMNTDSLVKEQGTFGEFIGYLMNRDRTGEIPAEDMFYKHVFLGIRSG